MSAVRIHAQRGGTIEPPRKPLTNSGFKAPKNTFHTQGVRIMLARSKHTALSVIVLLAAILAGAVALPALEDTSTVFDPIGDGLFHNTPAFQDIVFAQLTVTPDRDLELLMELAGPVPVNPSLPPQGHAETWWAWSFDLDPDTFPQGYPFTAHSGRVPEFNVYISWDGAAFAGTAVDRRPLLTGGEAIITPLTSFSINGTTVEAVLAYEVIGDVPARFRWAASTDDWPGPVGTACHFYVDLAIFEP